MENFPKMPNFCHFHDIEIHKIDLKDLFLRILKIPVVKRTCEANPAGENSSFIFSVCIKSVPLYHSKIACVVLHTAVKNFSEPTSRNGEIGCFNLESHFLPTLKVSCNVLLNLYPKL